MLLPFFPQTTFILGLYGKPEDNLKLDDDGSELKALSKKERKGKHPILTRLGVRVGSIPRTPKRSVDKWAFSTLYDHRGPPRHYSSSWNSD